MKAIIISEIDNRGAGKIKFTLNGKKIFFEILDTKKICRRILFRIHKCNHIEEETRKAQQGLNKKTLQISP